MAGLDATTEGLTDPHPVHIEIFNKIAPHVNLDAQAPTTSPADDGDAETLDDTNPDPNDALDTSWTWPNTLDNQSWLKEYFGSTTYNGFKPFHQSSAISFYQDIGYPTYDKKGKFSRFLPLPSLPEIVKKLWDLLSNTVRSQIKDLVREATDNPNSDATSKIGEIIYAIVIEALLALGVPAFVIRVIIGVLIPRIILWILAHVDSLQVAGN